MRKKDTKELSKENKSKHKIRNKRLIAFIIDIYAILMISFIITFIISNLVFIKESFNIIDKVKFYFNLNMFTSIIIVSLKDLVFKNASIGKKLMKIKIVTNNNEIPSPIKIIIRDLLAIIWPIDAITIISFDKKIIDIILKTKVIENLEKNKSNKKALISLIVIFLCFMFVTYFSIKEVNNSFNEYWNINIPVPKYTKETIINNKIVIKVMNFNSLSLDKLVEENEFKKIDNNIFEVYEYILEEELKEFIEKIINNYDYYLFLKKEEEFNLLLLNDKNKEILSINNCLNI